MEYDKRKQKPESTRSFLIRQVQGQSNLCDVVVKMGYWEKKFHRCVLVVSPFFDRALNDNFLEKLTGKIEIMIGTPITLETAIMFLYGQKTRFNQENIEDILDMAEFLFIPNLKSACIDWLKSVTITEENCIRFLQLASIYDFEIPKCTDYIEKYLPKMLLNPQMLTLTEDSIHLLFSDKRLSYVSMDDKLSFLLKPEARKFHTQVLLTVIDFREISQPLKELTKNLYPHCVLKLETSSLFQSSSRHVLIMNGEYYDGTFWCLDLERLQWFRVESVSFKEELYDYKEISGTKEMSSESVIYFVKRGYLQPSILMLDLSIDAYIKLNVKECDESFKLEQIDDLKIDNDICIVSANEEIEVNRKLDRYAEINGSLSLIYMKTSTLYIGHIDKDNVNIEMSPLLAFKNDEILQFLISQNAIAIIFTSQKHVAIYDLVENHLDKIEQSTENNDKLAQFKDGFVIYDNKRCILIKRLHGTCLSKKYNLTEIKFEQNLSEEINYIFCGQMWYRYFREICNEHFIFECIPLHIMLSKKPEEYIAWKQIPLPIDASSCKRNTIRDECFEICLPKSKLRCSIECPHCKRTDRAVTIRNDNESDGYSNRDSSDDDDYVQ